MGIKATLVILFLAAAIVVAGFFIVRTAAAESLEDAPNTCDQARDSNWRVSAPIISSSGYVSHSFKDIYGGDYHVYEGNHPYIRGFLVRESGGRWGSPGWVSGSRLKLNVGDAVRVCVAQPAPEGYTSGTHWFVLSPAKRH